MDDSVFSVVTDIVAEEGSIKCETVQFKAGSILCLVCPGLNKYIRTQDNRIKLLIVYAAVFSLKHSVPGDLLIHWCPLL